MNTSNTTFFIEINTKLSDLNNESEEVKKALKKVMADKTKYHSHAIASKEYYNLLARKFRVALKKEKLKAILTGETYNYRNCIRPVYNRKISQYEYWEHVAPRRLNL